MGILLPMAMMFAMAGCSSNSYTYLTGSLVDYTLRVGEYSIKIPDGTDVSQKFNSDIFTLEDDSYGTIYAVVSSNRNNETIAEYIDIDSIDNYYNFDRTSGVKDLLSYDDDLSFSDDFEEASAGNYSTLECKNSFDIDEKTYLYVSYDFFADADEFVPFEVFVFSEDSAHDALEKCAIEIISTISEAEADSSEITDDSGVENDSDDSEENEVTSDDLE